jgi:catechol 2,3-dioxygenase-like lactoylglutathione lyase family enzyme
MHLTRVSLPVRHVSRAADFYRQVLGLPTVLDGDRATVTVGTSRLELRPSDGAVGSHHLAFTIPAGTFDRARTWLTRRLPLLSRDGVDEFEGPPSWNSRSLYFGGPENAVLELIERRGLPGTTSEGFSVEDLRCISEIGLAVPDVEDVAEHLRTAGLAAYGGPPGPGFTAVGDADGLLILVSEGRAWLPTTDRLVGTVSTAVEAVGAVPGRYRVGASSTLTVS